MIPKIIHYFWFGGNEMPLTEKTFIDNWKKLCPDYKFILWNEKNYDIHKNKFIEEAYQNKKYSFVTDFARLDVIFQFGGFYFDTDVELIKPLEQFLSLKTFFGFENDRCINTGHGFGSEPRSNVIKTMMETYQNRRFVLEGNFFDTTPCTVTETKVLKEYGIEINNRFQNLLDVTVFPSDYFSPIDYDTNRIFLTKNTVSIHHYHASWLDKFHKKSITKKQYLFSKFGVHLGKILYFPFKIYYSIRAYGFKIIALKIKKEK